MVRDDIGNEIGDSDSFVNNNDINEDDQDEDLIIVEEVDPNGLIYCEKAGRLVTGGTVTVSGRRPVDSLII